MMWSDHGGWNAADWVAMSFMLVLLGGLLAALVGWLLDRSRGQAAAPTGQRDHATHADEVLAERFARGEIDEAEFIRRRDLLRAASVHS